ncbi:MAG: FAD:protein FMN transferase [Brevinematales bacterium]|nr:FAD:protein FMN transferase [Brevinematales bacterium]
MDRISIILLILFSLLSCGAQERYEYRQFLMDTVFEVIIYTDKPKSEADSAVNGMFAMLGAMELKYSIAISNSSIATLNREKAIDADPEMMRVFSNTLAMSEWTSGAFDPTIYPVVKLWGFYSGEHHIPAPGAVKFALKPVGYKKIALLGEKIALPADTFVDLGGILKGYAVDRGVDFLKNAGILNGIVNAGGNLKVFGAKPDKTPWAIGIRHPRKEGEIIAVIYTIPGKEISVATSGDYERYFIEDGVRYHHIMSPFTGYPVRNGVVSVSVLDPSAMLTDGLSTSIFVMGLRDGMEFAEKNALPVMIIIETNGQLIEFKSAKWKDLEAECPAGEIE